MSSKSTILESIRRRQPPPMDHPTLDRDWIRYPDPAAQFAEVLTSVGGRCEAVANLAELNARLEEIPAYREARTICSLVPGAGRSTLDAAAVDDPHQLEHVDFAILRGELAVAENAAVWVSDSGLRHRVLYFLPQHLALVVPAGEVVDNLHQAYRRLERLSSPREGENRWFGTFISGPSKTADIEQSLVIGAHGARSLTVFLLGGE